MDEKIKVIYGNNWTLGQLGNFSILQRAVKICHVLMTRGHLMTRILQVSLSSTLNSKSESQTLHDFIFRLYSDIQSYSHWSQVFVLKS